MNPPPPAQLDLVGRDPSRCPRCGAVWPGIFVEKGMDLHAVLELDSETFRAVSRCWTGGCSRGTR